MDDGESLGSVSRLFLKLSEGDEQSAHEFWTRYFPRLTGLTRTIIGHSRLPLCAEDVVQEAFLQFFAYVQQGRVKPPLNRSELWRILSRITSQKARKQVAREATQRRGGGLVHNASQLLGHGSSRFSMDQVLDKISSNDCDIIAEEMLQLLSTELREVAILRMAGYRNLEIKDFLDCSLRSVERRIQLIRTIWHEYTQAEQK